MIPHHAQMELKTIIPHGDVCVTVVNHADTHKPLGVRLAKMLGQYDDQPSSQLWSDIQRLAREILK
jgi:hypothetical protein